MIKIAYVINYIVKNGPSAVVLSLIDNLNKNDYDISLITLFPGNDPDVIFKLQKKHIKVYECTKLSRAGCILGQADEFQKLIERENFDIVHTHGFVPDILSSRLKHSARRITTIHNNMYEDYLNSYGYLKSRVFIALHLAALRKLDLCVCCSESVYHVMKGKIGNSTYIRNGIEPANAMQAFTRKSLGIPQNARVFLYAGTLNEGKNIVWLIKKFVQSHNDDEFLLVLGKGECEAECKTNADDHVRMLGFRLNPTAYMAISDIYVSASKSEGFSLSVLEALSCGLGVLLSDIPSHREIIDMPKEVYIGERFSNSNFDEKLNQFREIDLDRKAIATFQRKQLSAAKMTAQYDDCYKKYAVL